MTELLFEIGCEELPSSFVGPAIAALAQRFSSQCAERCLVHEPPRCFATPRRLALLVHGVRQTTEPQRARLLGPPVSAGVDADGAPSLAARRFAARAGVEVEKLGRVETERGVYLAAESEQPGRPALEVLPEILQRCLRDLAFPRSMRWNATEQVFARPLRWIVALLDDAIVPCEFADVPSGRLSRGHRFSSPGPLELARAGDYERLLADAGVIADVELRRRALLSELHGAAAASGATLVDDPDLVAEVVNLLEVPHALVGNFDPAFLDLPREVVRLELARHQRYFSLQDGAGRLLPRFVAVAGTRLSEPALAIRGFERVLAARLSDARFFFDADRKQPLADVAGRLSRRTWALGLGTMADKSARLSELGSFLCERTGHAVHVETLRRAALLCKADLETRMVAEFPELEGVMGREYALHDREPAAVAQAIAEHYLPRSAAGAMPESEPGALLGLADRFDLLVGLFVAGKRATAEQDPWGLRRAALGVIRITLARGYRYSLAETIERTRRLFTNAAAPADAADGELMDFFGGRLTALWQKQYRADVIEAVLAAGFDDLLNAHERLEALSRLLASGEINALVAVAKRIANIIRQAGVASASAGELDASALIEPAERALHERSNDCVSRAFRALARHDVGLALTEFMVLEPWVSKFFDEVRVLSEDRRLRDNRLRLLNEVSSVLAKVADLGKLRIEKTR